MAIRKLLTWVFLIFAMMGKSQTNSPFLNEGELLRIQRATVSEMPGLLTAKGWSSELNLDNPIYSYFDFFPDYKFKKWEIRNTSEWYGSLFVYFKEGVPNLILYQTTYECFNRLRKPNFLLLTEPDFITYLNRQNGQLVEYREYKKDSTRRKFSILVYRENSLKGLLLTEKERLDDFNRNLNAGNIFFKGNQFEKALYHYEEARKNSQIWDFDARSDIVEKIQTCRTRIQKEAFDSFMLRGDSLLEKERFEEALFNFNKALMTDSSDYRPVEKINRIKYLMNVDELRKREQSYAYLNPADYEDYKTKNCAVMNTLLQCIKRSGSLNYTSTIRFDKDGNSQSILKINKISNNRLKHFVTNIPLEGVRPTRVLNQYVPSSEELNFDLTWKLTKVAVEVKYQKVEIQNDEYFTFKYNDTIKSFLNAQIYKNGLYHFEIMKKKLNGVDYEDLKLFSFRSNSGPVNFLNSLVFPGWGAHKVSDGKKGKGRMMLFCVFSAITVGSKIYSKSMYSKYQDDINHNEAYYKKADFANKMFLAAGGITASIYLSDIIYTVFRGTKNNIKSRSLKMSLKECPVSLVKSPLKP